MAYSKKQVKKLLHAQIVACANKFGKLPMAATSVEILTAIRKTELVKIPELDKM